MRLNVEFLHNETRELELKIQRLESQMHAQSDTAMLVELQIEIIQTKKLLNDCIRRMRISKQKAKNCV